MFATFAEYAECLHLQQSVVMSMMVVLTWTRKCNLTVSGDNYVDLMIFQGSTTLANVFTYESNWQTTSRSVFGLLPYTNYKFKVREVQMGQNKGLQSQFLSIQTKEAGM